MIPFDIQLRPGRAVSEQVVFAVKRAVARGVLRPGDSFPSVRGLGKELRINPNTAQKIVAALTREGVLEIEPGIGARVANPRHTHVAEKEQRLREQMEVALIEARLLGMGPKQIRALMDEISQNLNSEEEHDRNNEN